MGTPLTNSQGDGLMAYISRKDCAKAVAYALHRSGEFTQKVWDINGPELMTITQFIEIGNESTGNNLTFQNVTDEEIIRYGMLWECQERRTAYSWKTVKLRFQAMEW